MQHLVARQHAGHAAVGRTVFADGGKELTVLQFDAVHADRHLGHVDLFFLAIEQVVVAGDVGGAAPILKAHQGRLQAAHAAKLARLLARLDAAQVPGDMNLPGWGLHPLHGSLTNHWAVSVNGNWRITFTFDGTDAVLLDYLDYH